MSLGKCQVCEKNDAIGVASGACGPISIAYCRPCLQMGAEPFDILAAYLGCAGLTSIEHVSKDYHIIIENTCNVAGKTLDEFWAACAEANAETSSEGQ